MLARDCPIELDCVLLVSDTGCILECDGASGLYCGFILTQDPT